MEIAPNIHRLEVPIGDRFVCVFLMIGSEGILLLDTGLDDTPALYIKPYLAKLGYAPSAVRYVINSHADLDHTGGNMSMRELSPSAIFMCHELDCRMVEDLEWMIAARYGQFVADHGIEDSDETTAWIRSSARHCPIDLALSGGEKIHLGNDWHVDIMFTPGHTRGHITLYDPRSLTALIADSVLGSSILTTDGQPAFPPTYRYVDAYVSSIHLLQALPIELLLTSHYPIYQGLEAAGFLSASREYVDRVDRTLIALLRDPAGNFTLQELISALKTELGEWPDGAEILLDFPLYGHLERLLLYGKVKTTRRDNLLAYTWID